MLAFIKAAIHSLDREAWIRFFIAVFGLGLAFASAILSTVMRESGNLVGTAIFASAALLIAGVVGLTTVPYLAKRVVITRVREAFDYDVTREGVVYLITALVIGIAALNTGNNLLFIVVSAMLAAIIVSGIASAVVLRGLKLEVTLPEHVFAKRGVSGRLRLHNVRRFLPSFSVRVVPPKARDLKLAWRWEHSVWAFPSKRPPERQWLRLPDLSLRLSREPRSKAGVAGENILQSSIYFPFIPPKTAATADLELHFDRRGRYVQDSFGLSTRFPFSFLAKTRRVALVREIIVYPSVEPTDEFFEVLPLITGEFEAFVRGRGYDLYRIREYMPEDSARHVDWKATAKSGGLKVREFTREDERKLRIVFDNPPPESVSGDSYENAVALAASLSWHFAGEDADLSFAASGYDGDQDVYEFLRHLALIAPEAAESILDTLQVTDDYNVILTARPRGSIPTQLWASSYFVFIEKT